MGVVALAGAGLCATWAGCRAKDEPPPNPVVTVDVAPVLNSPIQRTIRVDAVLYPAQQAAIVPKIVAPVKAVYVERGTRVRAGQLLVELENQDLASAARESQAAYELAEATYETTARAAVPQDGQKAELEVRAAKGALDAQQAVYDSRQNLFTQGAIARKDVNDAQVALTQARNQFEIASKRLEDLQGFGREQALKAAAAQRDVATAHLDAAQAQLGYSRITSPIDGVVTDRPVYPGETPAAGAPVVTVMDVSHVVARAHIPQAEAAELKVGDEASLVPPDGTPRPGKVIQISPALDQANTTLEVWASADNPDQAMKPGTTLRLELVARTVSAALVIPQAALVTSASGATSVVVIDAENKPHKTPVGVGIRDAGKVQVTDGLESGQRVVTTGAFELAKLEAEVLAKTKVQIQPPKEDDEDDEQ